MRPVDAFHVGGLSRCPGISTLSSNVRQPIPREAHLYAVLDANLYRQMGNQALQDLMALERREGVRPLVALWPSLELLTRLLDPDSSESGSALAALRRIVAHCGSVSDGHSGITFTADHELTLVGGLLGRTIPHRALDYQVVASLLKGIARGGPPERGHPSYASIERIAEFVARRESAFVQGMNAVAGSVQQFMSITGLDERATRAQVLSALRSTDALGQLAEIIVLGVARLHDATPTDAERLSMRQLVLLEFPVAMAVMRRLLEKAVRGEANWNLPRNVNSLWDQWLSYHASRGAVSNGSPILLVTEDNLIHEAADEVGHESFVAREAEYRELLASGKVAARAARMLAASSRGGGGVWLADR